ARQPLLERRRAKRTARVVGPAVIETAQASGVATDVADDLGTAVRTAIDEDVNRPVAVAGQDDRRPPDRRGPIVAGGRYLGLDADEGAGRTPEDPLVLALEQGRIDEELIGNPGNLVRSPILENPVHDIHRRTPSCRIARIVPRRARDLTGVVI